MAAVGSSTSGTSENWLNRAQEGSSNTVIEGSTGAAAKPTFKPTAGLSFKPGGTTSSAPAASAPPPKQKTAPDQVPPIVKQHLDEAVEAWHAYERVGIYDDVEKTIDHLKNDILSTMVKSCNGQCNFTSAQKATAKLERAVLNDTRHLKMGAAATKERQEIFHMAVNSALVNIAYDDLINATAANKKSIIKQVVSWIVKDEANQDASSKCELFEKLEDNAVGPSAEKINHLIRDLDTKLDSEEKRRRIPLENMEGCLPKLHLI